MTIIAIYPSKKALKEHIGKPLNYVETSIFGSEFKPNGTFIVANRPHITKLGREFFAEVTMEQGLIKAVR